MIIKLELEAEEKFFIELGAWNGGSILYYFPLLPSPPLLPSFGVRKFRKIRQSYWALSLCTHWSVHWLKNPFMGSSESFYMVSLSHSSLEQRRYISIQVVKCTPLSVSGHSTELVQHIPAEISLPLQPPQRSFSLVISFVHEKQLCCFYSFQLPVTGRNTRSQLSKIKHMTIGGGQTGDLTV